MCSKEVVIENYFTAKINKYSWNEISSCVRKFFSLFFFASKDTTRKEMPRRSKRKSVAKQKAQKVAAEKEAAQKVAAEKEAAEKVAAEKEKEAAEKATTEKDAAEKLTVEKEPKGSPKKGGLRSIPAELKEKGDYEILALWIHRLKDLPVSAIVEHLQQIHLPKSHVRPIRQKVMIDLTDPDSVHIITLYSHNIFFLVLI